MQEWDHNVFESIKDRVARLSALYGTSLTTANFNQIGSATGSPVHYATERLRSVFEKIYDGAAPHNTPDINKVLFFETGDINRKFGNITYAMTTPVAPDVWYLCETESILPFKGEDYQDDANAVMEAIKPFTDSLGEIKPLMSLQSPDDIIQNFSQYTLKNYFTAKTREVIRKAYFETWLHKRSPEYPSYGSMRMNDGAYTSGGEGDLYSGYLSFPVGQLGVMQCLSIFSETMPQVIAGELIIEGSDVHCMEDGWSPLTDAPVGELDGLMTPLSDLKNNLPGIHLIVDGYVSTNRDMEYPAKHCGTGNAIAPFQSMRFYLQRNSQFPTPGEFIGMLALPFPYHVWWYQASCPMLYAGTWFETDFYTAGIVKEKINAPDNEYGYHYKVLVRGVEIYIRATDFYEYEIGDTVALFKTISCDRSTDTTKGNFKWDEMIDLFALKKIQDNYTDSVYVIPETNTRYNITDIYIIVPVSFYQ